MKSVKLGFILFIVQFALCLSLAVSASALESTDSIDVSYSAEVESSAVGAGETVTVKIFLDNNAGFVASKFYVAYDDDKLTFDSFDMTESAFVGSVEAITLPEGEIQIAIGSLDDVWNENPTVHKNTGCVIGLVFKTAETEFEIASITVKVSPGNIIPPVMTDILDNPYSVKGDTLMLYGPSHQHTAGDWVIDAKPTCIEAGLKKQVCAVCANTIKTEEIPAGGHTEGEWITDKPATCTEEGAKHLACAVCTETIKTETIEKTAHGTEVDAAVAATCTATGLTEGSHCPDCSLVHVAQEVVDVIPHTYNNGVVTTAPTASSVGVKTFTCTACLATTTEEIAKLAPTMAEASEAWNKKLDSLPIFRTDAAFADFTEVRINDTVLAAENYTVSNDNGIKVELKREYLESLEIGEYKVEVVSASGSASATFAVESARKGCGSVMSTGVVVVVMAAAAFMTVKNKKKAD